jgi:beta-galactosidase beta subunit
MPTDAFPLYVEKPIGKYEPMQADLDKRQKIEFNDNRLIRKKGKPEPTTQAEIRDCSEELDGNKLQKISAGPQNINFKNVFVKSTTTKYFTVRNDLRQYIHIRMVIEHPELAQSGPLSQVVNPGQEAGFDLVFCSQKAQAFKGVITYFINDVHPFKFLVSAQADPVNLELSKRTLNFEFHEDSTEMSVSKNLVITNNGNDKAIFNWQISDSNVYVPFPMNDIVEPGKSTTCKVTFTPPGPKPEEELLTMKIENGVTLNVRCIGTVTESRCLFQEKFLDFGAVPVGIRTKEEVLHMK